MSVVLCPTGGEKKNAVRVVALLLVLVAAASGGAALAQSEPAANARSADDADEVIVRGRRLTELRFEVQQARERAYDIFNEINSDDDFDVRCRDETRYFSHSKRRVCRAQFEDRIAAGAATEYMRTLQLICPASALGPANIQDCIFSGYGQQAAQAARRVELQGPNKRDEMNEEILRLANENDEFAQAILDFYEADQRYDEARKRRDD